jgi:hypothetical protein
LVLSDVLLVEQVVYILDYVCMSVCDYETAVLVFGGKKEEKVELENPLY